MTAEARARATEKRESESKSKSESQREREFVSVCVREREREIQRDGKRERWIVLRCLVQRTYHLVCVYIYPLSVRVYTRIK